MPIPTPAPPVKRYNLKIAGEGPQDWCKWSEVEVLLLPRAQEIAEANEKFVAAEEDWHQAEREIADLKAQLTARAQEIEQVKATLAQIHRAQAIAGRAGDGPKEPADVPASAALPPDLPALLEAAFDAGYFACPTVERLAVRTAAVEDILSRAAAYSPDQP